MGRCDVPRTSLVLLQALEVAFRFEDSNLHVHLHCHWLFSTLIVWVHRFERFCAQGSCVPVSGERTSFRFVLHYCPLLLRFSTWENRPMMASTPTEQMRPIPNAITTGLVKMQPSSTFVVILFHSRNRIRGLMQSNIVMRGSGDSCYKRYCPSLHKRTQTWFNCLVDKNTLRLFKCH